MALVLPHGPRRLSISPDEHRYTAQEWPEGSPAHQKPHIMHVTVMFYHEALVGSAKGLPLQQSHSQPLASILHHIRLFFPTAYAI